MKTFNLNSFGNTHKTPDLKWVASSAETRNGSISGPSTELPRCQRKMGFKRPTFAVAINKSHLRNQDSQTSYLTPSKASALHDSRGEGSNSPNQSNPYLCSQEGTQISNLIHWDGRVRQKEGKQTSERVKNVTFSISTHAAEVAILCCNKQSSSGTIEVCQS